MTTSRWPRVEKQIPIALNVQRDYGVTTGVRFIFTRIFRGFTRLFIRFVTNAFSYVHFVRFPTKLTNNFRPVE